jgi:HK97 family phage prohead protease
MREQRFLSVRPELRTKGSADSIGSVVGYAAKFNRQSEDLGGFREVIAPGAFSATLNRGDDIRALVNHDPSLVLGRTKNGSLVLREDATGLRIACALPDTSYARDLYNSIKRGDINQMSFAFQVNDDGEDWDDDTDEDGDRTSIRTLKSVRLLDVSCVTYPAYSDTNVGTDDRVDPALVMGRSLFPSGIPAEIRSRFPGITQRSATDSVNRRRHLTNFVLGL